MHVKNKDNVNPLNSEHGEVVYELIGNAAGGSEQHSLAQIVIPPGKASLKHYHPVAEESYYILAGQGHMQLGDETVTLRAGDSVMIPPPVVHQISNNGIEDLVLLAVCVPAWTPDNTVVVD